MVATGSYNLAFQFWATTDSMSAETGITTEVMIWMDNNLIGPAGNIISIVAFAGFDYNLYRANWDSWNYFAFLSAVLQYLVITIFPTTNPILSIRRPQLISLSPHPNL